MSTNIIIQRTCVYCGKQFIAKTTVTKYCSHGCNTRHYKMKVRNERIEQIEKITIQRNCIHCGKLFIAKTTDTKYCSLKCNSRYKKIKIRAEKIGQSNLESYEMKVNSRLPIIDKEVLTVKNVADFLESSVDAIYDMVNSGRLKATKLSIRKTRILRSDVFALLESPSNEPIIKIVEQKVKAEKDEVKLSEGNSYRISDLIPLFGKSREALYSYLLRNKVSKLKIGKEILVSKAEVDKLYRKFKGPVYVGLDKEREANLRLAQKGLTIDECYSVEECISMFGKDRSLLYGFFKRRNVPKIRDGQKAYFSKKAVDRIYKLIKSGGEL